ncbi:DNA-binding response OmpR family regulator [Clostridium sardiniense]|nr:response regulator transcription factor [Clostridium sardiniense]MBM7834903.1 DNA-binding response OmpR family regulator [Clostridium sardiniense]
MNILIVEDNVDINNLISRILETEGYSVREAYSGSEGMMCIEQFEYDLVILDLMLPGISGEELIEKIRDKSVVPIVVISAKEGVQSKINVLKLGADDFISKPFDNDEVLARVEAQLRRYKKFSKKEVKKTKFTYKNLVLDLETRQAFIGNKEVLLTAREFSIIELLISNPKKVFTRANLFESAWNNEFLGDDNTVNVHISNLRTKLSKLDQENEYIKTVWGIGFKLGEEIN